MSDDAPDFEKFLKQRQAAARAYVNADAVPLSHLAARVSPATFFGPGGGIHKGAEEVLTQYEKDAHSFVKGGETHFEILHFAASGGVGYWVGFQKAMARLKGKSEPVPMDLRVTEVFRREGADWKLVHRHADMLVKESEKP